MYQKRSYLFPLLLSAALLKGCGEVQTDSPVELLWPERQAIFRLDATRAKLEVFSIRGGITPLGTVALPAAFCPTTMALDATGNRLWLWSARSGMVIDARSLRVVRQWQSESADQAEEPEPVRMISKALPVWAACGYGEMPLQAMKKAP
ncbi:MAG: hypothetical protein CVU25_02425 [Betaproteobacteria bacterium HGW-Betaproteobacteria-19]|nr:MAG: hypothetical protein CVU25_02425 [Betaproteobacteria bacterium HGW-Betaproteobacteria-19]